MKTTKKTPEEIGTEIQRKLKDYGLKRFIYNYEDGEISGCIFSLQIANSREIEIKLPISWKPLFYMAEQDKNRYMKTKEQARKVAWRLMLRWIESQLALIDVGMVDVAQVFFSYTVDDGKTLYQHFIENEMDIKQIEKAL